MKDDKQMVLACIDGSTLRDAVCDYAAWIAQRIDVPLKLLHTIDHHHETAMTTDLSGNIGLDSRDHLLEEFTNLEHEHSKLRLHEGKLILQAAKNRVMQNNTAEPLTCLQHGSLIESLVELEDSIRVLVVGARGKVHENHSDQIGAKLESMIRSLHRPILVAYETFKEPKRILIAYDGGEAAEKALELVAAGFLYDGLICHLVCVNKKDSADNLLNTAATKISAAGSIDIVCASLQGKTEEALCDYQRQHKIDLTVMGAFSHSRIHDLLLGSITAKMLLNTHSPLLLLR